MLIHSFPPIANAQSKILILGTMPGKESLRQQQYYGHSRNSFWTILFEIFDEPFSCDYHLRTQLLLKHHIALWDVLQHCERASSADTDIRKPVVNNIRVFLEEHRHIKHLFFNGKGAAQLYHQLIPPISISATTLPSTSPANTIDWKHKLYGWQQVKTYL